MSASLPDGDRDRVERYIANNPDPSAMEVVANTRLDPQYRPAVRKLLDDDADDADAESEPESEPADEGPLVDEREAAGNGDASPDRDEDPGAPMDTDADAGTDDEDADGSDGDLAVEDLLVEDDGPAGLPAEGEVRDAIAAATDYYHDQLEDTHRDLIRLKWGISSEMIDDLKIGFAPSDNGLVDALYAEGFMPLTLVRAGLASAPVVKHAYGIGDCPDECGHDVPEPFHVVGRMRDRNDVPPEEVDLGAVVAYAGKHDCLDLYAWWDSRIVFPYWSTDRPRYLIGRATGQSDDIVYGNGEVAKYVKQSTDKPWVDSNAVSEPIYGVDTVEEDEPLIITEGITDAIMAHQLGVPCISPVTKQFKSEHHRPLQLQAQRASEVYLCLDNEDSVEGLKGALKTGEALVENEIDARVATLPKPEDASKVDLADFLQASTHDEMQAVLDDAVPPARLIHDAEAWSAKYAVVVDGRPTLADTTASSSQDSVVTTPDPAGDSVKRVDVRLHAGEAADGDDDQPAVAVTYTPAGRAAADGDGDAAGEMLAFEPVGDRSDLWVATAPDGSTIRLLEYESESDCGERAPSQVAPAREGGSALFDLDIRDVTGMDHLDRGPNPIEHRGDSENYFVIIQEGGDYLAYDHKAEAGYYALTYLLCEAGARSVDDPTGRLDDEDIFVAWRHAKRRGYISSDDPAPYRALLHVVREHDLLPPDMVPDGDAYGDDNRLSATVYNRALDVIEDEYGVDAGRERAAGGQATPTEADLGLDEEPADNEEELQQFVKRARLNAMQAGDS